MTPNFSEEVISQLRKAFDLAWEWCFRAGFEHDWTEDLQIKAAERAVQWSSHYNRTESITFGPVNQSKNIHFFPARRKRGLRQDVGNL